MIFNANAQNDLNRIIRHIDNQLSAGLSIDESIAKLKEVESIDTAKVAYLENLLNGKDVDAADISPYKLANQPSLVKLVQLVASTGGSVKAALQTLQACLSVNKNNANQVWKGLKALSIYLFVILFLAISCTAIYTIKVLPQFQEMFDSFGAELPPFTQTVLGMSEFLVQWWVLVIPLILLFMYQLFKLGRKISTLESFDGSMKLVPGVMSLSKLHYKYLLVSYTHILISGGMDSEEAFKNALTFLGAGSADAELKSPKSGAFDDILIARELGTLKPEIEHSFNNIEHEYIGELAKLREKIMLFTQVALALIVSSIVIAMYLPIFQMGQVA